EEAEHVLLAGVDSRRSIHPLLRRLKIDSEVLQNCDQIGVVNARVTGSVNRAQRLPLGVELKRFIAAARKGFAEDASCRVWRQVIDRVLVDAGKPAELAETPVVHLEAPVTNPQEQAVGCLCGELARWMPAILGSVFFAEAVTLEHGEGLEALIRRP